MKKGTEPWGKTWGTENEGLSVNAATGEIITILMSCCYE